MIQRLNQRKLDARLRLLTFCAALALCLCGCAGASKPPDATGPRAGEPPYPILLTEDPNRREAVLAAWTTLAHAAGASGSVPEPELQPVTASVRSLPTASAPALYLPKVGVGATMSEEETNESLRRFIASEGRLLGADPQQLSLETITKEATGTTRARYRQEPFRRPLRNGYGVLEISFTDDRRIVQIYSTCIPEVERLRTSFTNLRLTPPVSEGVAQRLVGRTLTYTDEAGQTRTVTVGSNRDEITVRELVVFPRQRASRPPALELHMAWEITLGGAQGSQTIYLDAVTEELLGVGDNPDRRRA